MFPSDLHAKVFSNQQKTRISTNNHVVMGNTAREQSKNKVSKHKNVKETMTNIEPFSQKNALNGNSSSDNYTPVSKKDIARDDERIKKTNEKEKAKTKGIISDYSQSSKNLNKFQQGVTNEAKAYNNINTNPSLLNQNYITADNQTIRVNNAGVVNTIDPSSKLQENPPITPGINIASSVANPPDGVNYIQVENIPTGLTSGPDYGLYSQQTSATPVSMPSEISGYKLEGENVFVVYPYPDGVAAINQNMSYLGVFKPVFPALSQDSIIGINTTLKCVQHAIDQGFSVCGMTNYSDAYGGSGSSVVGNIASLNNPTPLNYAYNVIPVPTANAGLNFPTGLEYNMLTFGADGVLYAGYAGSGGNSLFKSALTPVFSSELNPLYGGTINNLVASYAYNQGYWNNLSSFATNSDYTGQTSGTYNTLYQYNIDIPNTGYYTETYNTWWGEQQRYIPYTYYTTQTETQLAAPNTAYGNLVYINYNCGNNTAPNAPTNVGGVNAGQGFNVTCSDLYNQFPSFSLTLSESGVLTISNNANSASNVTISIQFDNQQQATLSNGQVVTLNMPRPDWVSGSINNDGGNLTSSSMNTPSIGNGQWISSRTGLCRLILNNNMLQLEYSLQNATQDADGNLVGNDSSVALYSIQNVNASNLGSSAHIDINGAINPYTYQPVTYDSSYTEMKGYIPNPAILNPGNTNIVPNANDEQCRIACNNDPTCAGYVVYGNCYKLKAGDIFPTGGDRIPASQYSTYIRNPMFPQNDNSCRKTLDAVTGTDAYSYYLNNGITPNPPTNMTPQTKCNLGKVLDNQMNLLRERNQQAVEKGKVVKNQLQDLFERENNVLNSISENRDTSQFMNDITKMTNDQIQDIENAQITKSAAEKDSELLLVSDNYRYVIWGIVSLLLSIAAIKGMRMASS